MRHFYNLTRFPPNIFKKGDTYRGFYIQHIIDTVRVDITLGVLKSDKLDDYIDLETMTIYSGNYSINLREHSVTDIPDELLYKDSDYHTIIFSKSHVEIFKCGIHVILANLCHNIPFKTFVDNEYNKLNHKFLHNANITLSSICNNNNQG